MESIGQRMEQVRAPAGFDYLRIGLSLAVIIWHSIVVSYGVEAESWYWKNLRFLPANILPMFFALSGFLVAGSWERTRNLPQFLGYRGVRLLPALMVEVLLSALILGPLLTTLPLTDYFSGDKFRSYFINIIGIPHYYLPGVFETNKFYGVVNVTLWTLPYELECYLLLALLGVTGLRGQRRTVLLGLFAAALAIGTMLFWNAPLQASRPSGRVLVAAFAAGLLIYLYRQQIPVSRRGFWVSAVLGALLSSKASLALLSLPFVAYCTVYLGVSNPPKRTFLLRGDYSYGLYLFGFPLQQTYAYLFPGHQHWWANAVFAIGFGLLYAAFSWHAIEKPILKRRNEVLATVTLLPRLLLAAFRRRRPGG